MTRHAQSLSLLLLLACSSGCVTAADPDGGMPPMETPDGSTVPDARVEDAGEPDAEDEDSSMATADTGPGVEDATTTIPPERPPEIVCAEGHADCNGDPADLCEVALFSLDDCGACGRACAPDNAVGECSTGRCEIDVCVDGYADCDSMRSNGCESELDTDPRDCGACGVRCQFDGADALCVGGVCEMGLCSGARLDCDASPDNGCEVNGNSDALNCGGCGVVCALTNAAPRCNLGRCRVDACDAGWGNCDGDHDNGCEEPLDTLAHCGGCGRRCDVPNASEICSSGTCMLVECQVGFADCDGRLGNGCEANLMDDDAHCGACGVTCGAGTTCVAGVCA